MPREGLALTLALMAATVVCGDDAASTAASPKRNVLFLFSDDLRPELNEAYGQAHMHTPNLDKLARKSVVFDRAYTNFAICSASRNRFVKDVSILVRFFLFLFLFLFLFFLRWPPLLLPSISCKFGAHVSFFRSSFMTGRMPDRTQVWNFINDVRQAGGWDNETNKTLPQYFKENGYLTLGAGKLWFVARSCS